MGGIIVAYELARQLGLPAIFTERDDSGLMTLRRGFEVHQGQNILIAEDVVTTGKSSLESAKVLETNGAKVVALACVVDRRAEGVPTAWPLYSACKESVQTWTAEECPLCASGSSPVKPGSRKIF
jgi:orotate phosphoribosyltransferase